LSFLDSVAPTILTSYTRIDYAGMPKLSNRMYWTCLAGGVVVD